MGDELNKTTTLEEGGEMVDDSTTSSLRKHPLEHSWTFWFDNPSGKSKQAAWGSSIRPIYTFSTVEDFWSVYNNIHHPSKLAVGADFHCFKNKIEPKWEDPVCANGGKWTMSFSRGKSDTCWLYTLLALIGEQFDHGDEICGAVVNVRVRQEKIAFWTRNAANETAQVSIGKQWKEFLDYDDTIGFIFHDDAKKLDRAAKNCYSVQFYSIQLQWKTCISTDVIEDLVATSAKLTAVGMLRMRFTFLSNPTLFKGVVPYKLISNDEGQEDLLKYGRENEKTFPTLTKMA